MREELGKEYCDMTDQRWTCSLTSSLVGGDRDTSVPESPRREIIPESLRGQYTPRGLTKVPLRHSTITSFSQRLKLFPRTVMLLRNFMFMLNVVRLENEIMLRSEDGLPSLAY